ncbi:MAG: carboxylating nicotinate-nucleotide diphosphorylase [Marinagarivorans sp.]|nr:carboxylating nicotinate-nucleotide diphosphorylase [Marinagarivorans sp.]
MSISTDLLRNAIVRNVRDSLEEDIQTGDITANLIPPGKHLTATVISREPAVMCGHAWVDEVFAQLDAQYPERKATQIHWLKQDGDEINTNDTLFEISGNARTLLTGERSALNLLQTLCGTATLARHYAKAASNTNITLLDTRKTLPGLRIAQKYAVAIGGCRNHRLGLWDAFLIKENHIAACGGIAPAIDQARISAPDKAVQIEVETLEELAQAIAAKADIIMLDNFSQADTLAILSTPSPHSIFELSGNIELANFSPLPSGQAYRVSVGALTKHLKAIDLSFRVQS